MRFKEFLNESSIHSSFEYDEIVGLIAQDCEYFLEESKGLPLLRGIRHASSEYFHTPQPKNRTAEIAFFKGKGYYAISKDMLKEEGFSYSAFYQGMV